MVYHMTATFDENMLQNDGAMDGLKSYLRIMKITWEARHDANCCHEDTTIVGKLYVLAISTARIFDTVPTEPATEQNVSVKQEAHRKAAVRKTENAHLARNDLERMRNILKDARFEPIKWAIYENLLLERLHPLICSLPRIQL